MYYLMYSFYFEAFLTSVYAFCEFIDNQGLFSMFPFKKILFSIGFKLLFVKASPNL
jgi:hypothetical protein